jgi:hypothetical protein
MSVLIEGLTLVVKKLQLEMGYPGGADAFLEATLALETPPRFACTGDEWLVHIGFHDPDHLMPSLQLLYDHGLVAVDDGVFVDMAFVDQHHGPTMPCPWLEWKRHKDGFTFAWIAGTDPSGMVVYEGWTPENSRGMERFDVRDDPDRILPLGTSNGLETALDLKTGHVIEALPHRDLDPADGPLPARTTTAAPDAAASDARPELPEIDDIMNSLFADDVAEPEEQDAALWSLVIDTLDRHEISYVQENGVVRSFLNSDHGLMSMWVRLAGSDRGILAYVHGHVTVPEERMAPMLEAVALANYGLNCGAFELDPRDGELRFRNSLWLCDSEPGPEAMDRLIMGALHLFERYQPAFLRVIYGGIDAYTAIGDVELKS